MARVRGTVRAAEIIARADGKGTENGKPPSSSANIVKTHDGVHDIHFNLTEQQLLACLKTPGTTTNILFNLGYPRRTRNYERAKNRLLALSLKK